ncbi:MAG: sulfite exporter TauE/SafE family protein [Nitrospirae bacterium]|nr:sulfite exporter TauE/SafE family protein [Nitrospirota bacterium]
MFSMLESTLIGSVCSVCSKGGIAISGIGGSTGIGGLAIALFLTGITGGFGHCIGMCGPLVAVYSAGLRDGRWFHHVLFNLGRITTYAIAGGFAGLTGSFVSVVSPVAVLQRGALLLTGIMLVLVGLVRAGWLTFKRASTSSSSGKTGGVAALIPGALISGSLISRRVHVFRMLASAGAYYPFGILTGFLPCGLLYGVVLAAAGAGASSASPVRGVITGVGLLASFGVGTSLSMLLLGGVFSMNIPWFGLRFGRRFGQWFRERSYKFSALFLILVGGIFLFRAWR